MRKSNLAAVMAVIVFASMPAMAGTLRIGQPVIEGETVTVPVVLEGEVAGGVAALSFQLNYDPAAVEPQQASAGAAAQSAGKEVMTNVKEPGTYMVVMAGLNSNTVTAGEVTNIVLQRRGDNSSTNISITGTTFASLEGEEIPSRGSTGSISFGQPEQEDGDDTGEEAPDNEEETSNQENEPEEDKTSEPVPINVADSDPAPRRTSDRASTVESPPTVSSRPASQPSSPAGSETETDAGAAQELADALTAAATSRSSIGARPSETQDAAQEKPIEGETGKGEVQTPETQVAAITEGTEPAAVATVGTSPADEAAAPGATAPGSGTASAPAVQEIPAPPDESRMPLDDTPNRENNSTRTVAFLVIIVAVVAGILLLRKRLFA